MPQLDISTYVTQIFWLLVSFISFWLIMDRIVIPRIAEKIEARKRKYDDFIRKADEINQKALDTLKQYEDKLAVAKAKASEQIAQSERMIKETIAAKENEINQQLKQKMAENEIVLDREKAKLMGKIEAMSKDTAYIILNKLELTSITKEDIDEAVMKEDKAS